MSTPRGRVPNALPQSPASRLAQKASATAAGACRTSSEPCSTSAIRSTSRRARALDVVEVGQAGLQPDDRVVQPRVGAAGQVHLGEERVDAGRLARHRAQDVERLHVARALPDRVERRLAVEPRQAGVLDVAVAAQALQRLGRRRRAARLHTQYLPTATASRLNACSSRVARAGPGRPPRPAAASAWSPPRTRAAGRPARCASAACRRAGRRRRCGARAWCTAWTTAARMPAALPMTQSSRVIATISMMVRTPRPSLADQPGDGAVELRLAAGVAAVAELVLEPLDAERVARAVRQDPRHEEAGQPGRRLGEHEEQVAHRRAGEPLVAAQAPGAVARRRRGGRVRRGRRSRPASRSCPCRRAARALLVGTRRPGSYVAAGEQRLVDRGQLRCAAQRRDDRVRHRDRAAVAGLDLPPGVRTRRRARRARPGGRRPTARRPGPRSTATSMSACQAGWNSTSSIRWP